MNRIETKTPQVNLLLLIIIIVSTVCLWARVGAELKTGSDNEPRREVPGGYGDYLNAFAIKLKGREGRDVVEGIAAQYGFRVKTELPHSGVFILEHPQLRGRSKRSSDGHLEALKNDGRILHAQQEVLLHRPKRRIVHDKQLELPIRTIEDASLYRRFEHLSRRDSLDGGDSRQECPKFKDPLFKDMWYLDNQGQSGGEDGLDLNVGVVWRNGITGKGVVVCILDDGVDHTHPDLQENYDPHASTDLNDQYDFKDDPMPDTSDSDNSHGTRCAGEVASAANNDVCGVGVAYNAKIGGVRVLDGPVSDALEAEALSFRRNYIHVYSASWGPSDDGATMEGPRHLALQALIDGVQEGRNGLGSIYVWATGNGGMYGDDCSADGYVSRPETLSVGSVNDWGRSPFFMENCSSTLAVVPSGGEDYKGQEEQDGEVKLKVITTDMSGGCIENFQGTSSAAPLAAGCMANVLQANPSLTWRDVQHIVVQGTRVPSVDSTWTINGAGRHVSHRFGFGLMDCGRMVGLAQTWEPLPEQMHCNVTRDVYRPLKYGGRVSDTIMSDGCQTGEAGSRPPIDRLEHVQVYVKMTSEVRGDTAIYLISPTGTRSMLLSPRPLDVVSGEWEFPFMTVHSWDENPLGRWTLEVHHRPQDRHSHKSSEGSSERTKSDLELLREKLDGEQEKDSGDKDSVAGYVKEWSLKLYGTAGTRHNRAGQSRDRKQAAYRPSDDDVARIKKREAELGREVKVKRAEPSPEVGKKTRAEEKKLDKKREKVARELWEILHAYGAKDVRKRVLPSKSLSKKYSDQTSISRRNKLREVLRLAEDVLEDLNEKKRGRR